MALGTGIYTADGAASLLQVRPRDVRRWMFGYEYLSRRAAGDPIRRRSEPLWKPAYAHDPELARSAIGFHDLLELRIVREFVRAGVPLIVVRRCLEAARQIFGVAYPMTAQRFLTDGRTLYSEAVGAEEGHGLLDLRTRQYAFQAIVKPSLYAGIEYAGDVATRWYPDPRRKSIVLDPQVEFGKPVMVDSGIPTATLYAAYLAEGSRPSAARTVAGLYEVNERHILAAVRFETALKAA